MPFSYEAPKMSIVILVKEMSNVILFKEPQKCAMPFKLKSLKMSNTMWSLRSLKNKQSHFS